MKRQIKQILSFILVLTIILSCQNFVFAEDVEEIAQVTDETIEVTDEVVSETQGEESEETTEAESKVEAVVLDGIEEEKDKTILYVATDGKDSNPGTIDKPLATLGGAKNKVRELKNGNALADGGAVVYFRGGDYAVQGEVEFRKEDSGTKDARIIYRNYPDEEVNFIGGAYLRWEDFKPVEDKAVLERIVETSAREHIVSVDLHSLGFKDLPEVTWPGTYSYWAGMGELLKNEYGINKPTEKSPELIVNGKGATIARYPNDGDMEIGAIIKDGNFEKGKEPAEFVVNDTRIKKWTKAEDAILYGTFMYSWASLATPLGSIDEKNNSVTTKYPIYYGAVTGQLFHVFNLIEELDMPGEYYIDRNKGVLYLYPFEEEVKEVIYTMHTGSMFHFYGAEYITVKGINMKYSRGNFVTINANSKNIQVVDCEFTYNTNDASGAVSVLGPDCQVYDCYFYDCAMGVAVQAGDRPTLTRGNSTVENCKFERCDRTAQTYQPAIYVNGVGSHILHNELSEAQHTILRFAGNFHDVSFNEIYNAVTNTDDMGAIYAGRDITQRGNVFKNNYIHDIGGSNRGTEGVHGIFFDDFWECADVVGNVFANITGAAITCAGSYNVVHNNILVNVGTELGESVRMVKSFNYGNAESYQPLIDSVAAMPVDSKVWVEAFPEIVHAIGEDGTPDVYNHIVFSNNVHYNSPRSNIADVIQETMVNEGNVFYKQDPGFLDAENEIYLLKEDSVVYTDIPDFKPVPFTRMGRYNERATDRAARGWVFCTDSPYVLKSGERVKTDKNQAIVKNETIYIPLRTGADAIDGTLTYAEETDKITVSANGKLLEFTDGETDKVTVSGTEYILSKPIVNIDGSNYLAVADIANIFGKHLVHYGNLTVISDVEGLFELEADDTRLLRYLETLLTLY